MNEDEGNGPNPVELRAESLTVGYRGMPPVIDDVDVAIRPGSFTAILGPNACGKSTLLKTCSKLLSPSSGRVLLNGGDVAGMRGKKLARLMGLLPQSPESPEGLTVRSLVARGRYPYQSLISRYSREDEATVEAAMRETRVEHLAERPLDSLSGGQRQRAWISLVLAQETELLLLDEPTTYLDIAHQYEVMHLLSRLNAQGKTVVAVLHDLQQAARFATDLVMMKDDQVVATGSPSELMTPETILEVYGLEARVIADPDDGTPVVLPR